VLIDRMNLYNCTAAALEERFDFPADRSSRVVLGQERQRREKENDRATESKNVSASDRKIGAPGEPKN
jgi:hypothetical protein